MTSREPKCRVCQVLLDESNWWPSGRLRNFRICIPCGKQERHNHYTKNRRQWYQYGNVYRGTHRNQIKDYMKKWRLDHKEEIRQKSKQIGRKSRLKRCYGMTEERFKEMEKQQDGRCLICERQIRLVIDHDHKTGKVRGLLCVTCNMKVGVLESRLYSTILDYLGLPHTVTVPQVVTS